MGKTYDLFEFDQGNVRAEYVIDESKGLVERVYVEALNAETANAYMESLGADFEDKCRCCGVRWYKAMRPMWAEDHIDVRYSEKRVAVHKIDGSFVIWTPAYTAPSKTAPMRHYDTYEPAYEVVEPKGFEEIMLKVEEERIAKANEPRYNALPPEDEMKEIAYAKAELLSAIDKNTARKAQAETRFAIREHIDAMYELIDKL